MNVIRRTLAYRKEPKYNLFFVKEKQDDGLIVERGMACAIEMEIRGEGERFLLTSSDIMNNSQPEENEGNGQGEVFFEQCYRPRFSRSKKKFKKGAVCYESSNVCLIPINFKPEEQVKVVPESENSRRAECRSFFVTRDSFTIAKWEYNKDENKYHLNPPTELTAGSPVLCRSDKNKRNYVVGVIRHQNSNPEYFPEMFNRESLQRLIDRPDTVPTVRVSKEPEAGPTGSKNPEAGPTSSKKLSAGPTGAKSPDAVASGSKELDSGSTDSKEPEAAPTDPKEPESPGVKSQDPGQTDSKEPEAAPTDSKEPESPGVKSQDPGQTDSKEPEAAPTDSKEPESPGVKSQDAGQTGSNEADVGPTASKEQPAVPTGSTTLDTAPTSSTEPDAGQTASKKLDAAPSGSKESDAVSTDSKKPEAASNGSKASDADPNGLKAPDIGPNGSKGSDAAPTNSEAVEANSASSMEPETSPYGSKVPDADLKEQETDFTERNFIGNCVIVPKSLVCLLFLMMFILGVLAMEWWFPRLTALLDIMELILAEVIP